MTTFWPRRQSANNHRTNHRLLYGKRRLQYDIYANYGIIIRTRVSAEGAVLSCRFANSKRYRSRASVLECASRLALWREASAVRSDYIFSTKQTASLP